MLQLGPIALALFAAAACAAPTAKTTDRPPANATRPHRGATGSARPPPPPTTTTTTIGVGATSEPNNAFRTETEATEDGARVTMAIRTDESSAQYSGFTPTDGEAVAPETTQTVAGGATIGSAFASERVTKEQNANIADGGTNAASTKATNIMQDGEAGEGTSGSNSPGTRTTQPKREGDGGKKEIVVDGVQRERTAPVGNVHVTKTGTHSIVVTRGGVENTVTKTHAAAPATPSAAAQASSTPKAAKIPSRPPTATGAFTTIPPTALSTRTSTTRPTTTQTTTPTTTTPTATTTATTTSTSTRATSTTTSTVTSTSSTSSTKKTTPRGHPRSKTAPASANRAPRSTVTPHPVGAFTEPNPHERAALFFAAGWAADLAASPELAAIIGGILLAGALAAAAIVYQWVGVRRRVMDKTPDTATELYSVPKESSVNAPPMPAAFSE